MDKDLEVKYYTQINRMCGQNFLTKYLRFSALQYAVSAELDLFAVKE